jgi:hypothetical protein
MMLAKCIPVLGGGFVGLWSAVGAARKLDERGKGPDAALVTLVNRDHFLNLRTLIDDSSPLAGAIPSPELVELIKRLKSFVKRIHATARSNRVGDSLVPAYRWESSLPLEVAQVLYNLAGALAFLRCRTRIIGLDNDQYRKNLTWVLRQPWLDARLRPLFFAVIMELREKS